MKEDPTEWSGLMALNDPYRSMALSARDIADWLENAGHQDQAATVRDLLEWIVDQGRSAR